MKYILLIFSFIFLFSCGEEVIVKPKAYLALEYPEPRYKEIKLGCPFSFEVNALSNPVGKDDCWLNLEYPNLKATIYLTYRPVAGNLDSLLYDAQKLTYDHTIKASTIYEQPRVDSINDVYGMLYMINGDAATSTQFYVTDSTNHFITGSLYFKSKPNFDSIFPAISYLRGDVRHIMETIHWKE